MREDTSRTQRELVLLGSAPADAPNAGRPNGVRKDDVVFGEDPKSSVAIPKTLMAEIWDQARDGVRSLKVGGLEIGGLLVGRKVNGERVVVEEAIPLTIEYREGPSFQMSSSDLAGIAPAIESAQHASKIVVGFYRSRTRGDGVLRPSDRVILEAIEKAHASFPEDFRCCVVLAPKTLTLAEVSVALHVGNGWMELRPITLQSNAFPGLAESATSALEPFARAEKPVPPPMPATRPRVPENRPRRISPRYPVLKPAIWQYAAVALFAAGGMWVATAQPWTWWSPKQEATAPPVVHIGFSATREGPRWRLTWNPAAVDTLKPVGGVVSIQEGIFEQEIPLGLPDLASGTLFYTARTENLTLSLRIDRGGSHVEEQVRVVTADDVETPTVPVRARRAETSAPQVTAAGNVETARRPAPTTPEVTVELSAPAAAPLPATGREIASSNPRGALRRDTGRVAPVAARVTSALPLFRTIELSRYVAPKPIQQSHPQAPANLSSGLEAQLSIEIDTRGKVTKVVPIGWRPMDAPLVVWAVRAVSAWVFEPATSDGRAVASEVNLIFRS
jgi:hypothetical protein